MPLIKTSYAELDDVWCMGNTLRNEWPATVPKDKFKLILLPNGPGKISSEYERCYVFACAFAGHSYNETISLLEWDLKRARCNREGVRETDPEPADY